MSDIENLTGEYLPTHAQADEMNKNLEGIKNAILSTQMGSSGDTTLAGILANVRNGGHTANLPTGTVLSVNRNPTVSSHFGTVLSDTAAGITAISVDSDVFLSHEGIVSGGKTLRLVYDGAEWRLNSEAGDKADDLKNYGITATGTPKEGDLIEVFETASNYDFEVVDHDVKTYVAKSNLVLYGKKAAYYSCFGAPQLLFCATKKAMPAGKYKITLYHSPYKWQDNDTSRGNQDGSFVFTTTKEIPQYGGFMHTTVGTNNASAQTLSGTFSTYGIDHDPDNPLESGIETKAYDSSTDSDAVDLGTFCNGYYAQDGDGNAIAYENDYGIKNFTHNCYFGSGDYAVSYLDEALNSELSKEQNESAYDGTDFTKMPFKSYFNMRPNSSYAIEGFLHGIENDFKNALTKVKVTYIMDNGTYNLMTALGLSKPLGWTDKCDASVSGKVVTMERKVFAASQTEVGGVYANEKSLASQAAWARYEGLTNSPTAERIKNNPAGTSALWYWLRSPHPDYSCLAFGVFTDGSVLADAARTGRGAVPACVVS